jgi:hypothetical protein
VLGIFLDAGQKSSILKNCHSSIRDVLLLCFRISWVRLVFAVLTMNLLYVKVCNDHKKALEILIFKSEYFWASFTSNHYYPNNDRYTSFWTASLIFLACMSTLYCSLSHSNQTPKLRNIYWKGYYRLLVGFNLSDYDRLFMIVLASLYMQWTA